MQLDHFQKKFKHKRFTFKRNRFYGKRVNPVREPLKKGSGGINPCWKPSNEASKADLIEFHKEELKLRRRRQLAR